MDHHELEINLLCIESVRKKNQWIKMFFVLIKFADIKYENNTNITQSPGRNTFMTYLREIVSQKVNILMKTKLDIILNRKSG